PADPKMSVGWRNLRRLGAIRKRGRTMSEYKVGLIGCGWIAPFHLAALRKLSPRPQIVLVADPSRERTEAIAKQAQARALSDYREGLRDVDCAFVLVPHHLHHQVTLDCLNGGCHVLLEKPLANTLQQMDEMIATAQTAKKTFMIAYPH